MRNSIAVGCALALFAGACGGCSDSAASPGDGGTGDARRVVIDAKPVVIDARPEPAPRLEAEWDVSVADYISDIDQARMFSTGIVIVTDRELILIDKNDGHVIARTQLPGGPADPSPGSIIERLSGSLTATQMVFFEDEKESHLVRYEWSSTDLTPLSSTVLPIGGYDAAIADVPDALYFMAVESPDSPELVQIDDHNDIVARIPLPKGQYGFCRGPGVAAADGALIYAASLFRGGPIVFRIDPDASTVDVQSIPEKTSLCTLVPSPDRVLFLWYGASGDGSDANTHWRIFSRDGKVLLASQDRYTGPSHTVAYADGDFVTSYEFRVWAVDAEDGDFRGPYQLPVPREVWAGQERLVSDGTTLYAAVAASPGFGGQIHILKLKPLPRY